MNNWSRFVLIIWIFVVLILTQSYTASLASLLTVQRLQPTVVDIDDLKRDGTFVGYMKNSYIRELLIGQLNFNEAKLKVYGSPVESHEALSKGSKNGGVDAIFYDIPYVKLFLAKYCSKYMMVGPTYKSDGFGFVSIVFAYQYIYIYSFYVEITVNNLFLNGYMYKLEVISYLTSSQMCRVWILLSLVKNKK